MKEDDVVVVSSDSEEEEDVVWRRKSQNKQYQLLLEKIKPILYYQVQPGYKTTTSFPYARFQELANDLKKSLELVNVKSTQAFIWKNVIGWLVSIKLCYENVCDCINDRNYNLILTEIMAQYVNYKCQLYSFTKTDETEVGVISNEIVVTLSLVFSGWVPGILMTLLKIQVIDDYQLILYPIFRKYLSDKKLHETNDLISYLRLILCFRKWKKLAHLKEEKEIINEIAVGKSAKALRSDIIDLSTETADIDPVLPKNVPSVNEDNRAFTNITGLIGFALKNREYGTRILLINKALDLEDVIEQFFKRYTEYINRSTPKVLESSRADLKPTLIEDLTRSPSPDQLLPRASYAIQESSQTANKNKTNEQNGTKAVNQHLSNNCDIYSISINNKFNYLSLNSHRIENLSPSCKNIPRNRNNDVVLSNVDDFEDTNDEDDNNEQGTSASGKNSNANHMSSFEKRISDALDRLKNRAILVGDLVNRVNVEAIDNPVVAAILSDEAAQSNAELPIVQVASNNGEGAIPNPVPMRDSANPPNEKPIRKRHGIVSSTTSFEGTGDDSDNSEDDDGFGVHIRFPFSQRSYSKVVEEATSSTNENPKTPSNVASQQRKSISSSPCLTRASSPSPDRWSNISPSSTIRSGTLSSLGTAVGTSSTVGRSNCSIIDEEQPTCSRYVTEAKSAASFPIHDDIVNEEKIQDSSLENLILIDTESTTSVNNIETCAPPTDMSESEKDKCLPSNHTRARAEVPIIDKSTIINIDTNTCSVNELLKNISGFIGDLQEEYGFESSKNKCGPDKSPGEIFESSTNVEIVSNDKASSIKIQEHLSQSETNKLWTDVEKTTQNCDISFEKEIEEKVEPSQIVKAHKPKVVLDVRNTKDNTKISKFKENITEITKCENTKGKELIEKSETESFIEKSAVEEATANSNLLEINTLKKSTEDELITIIGNDKVHEQQEELDRIMEIDKVHENPIELFNCENSFESTKGRITETIESTEHGEIVDKMLKPQIGESKPLVDEENLFEAILEDESLNDDIESPPYEPICQNESTRDIIIEEDNNDTNAENDDFNKKEEHLVLKNIKTADHSVENTSAENKAGSIETIPSIEFEKCQSKHLEEENKRKTEGNVFKADKKVLTIERPNKENMRDKQAEIFAEIAELGEKQVNTENLPTPNDDEKKKIEEIINSDHDYVTVQYDKPIKPEHFNDITKTYCPSELTPGSEYPNCSHEIFEAFNATTIASKKEVHKSQSIEKEETSYEETDLRDDDSSQKDQCLDDLTVIYDTLLSTCQSDGDQRPNSVISEVIIHSSIIPDESIEKQAYNDENVNKDQLFERGKSYNECLIEKTGENENQASGAESFKEKSLADHVISDTNVAPIFNEYIYEKDDSQVNAEIAKPIKICPPIHQKDETTEKQLSHDKVIDERQFVTREITLEVGGTPTDIKYVDGKDAENEEHLKPLNAKPAVDQQDEPGGKQSNDVTKINEDSTVTLHDNITLIDTEFITEDIVSANIEDETRDNKEPLSISQSIERKASCDVKQIDENQSITKQTTADGIGIPIDSKLNDVIELSAITKDDTKDVVDKELPANYKKNEESIEQQTKNDSKEIKEDQSVTRQIPSDQNYTRVDTEFDGQNELMILKENDTEGGDKIRRLNLCPKIDKNVNAEKDTENEFNKGPLNSTPATEQNDEAIDKQTFDIKEIQGDPSPTEQPTFNKNITPMYNADESEATADSDYHLVKNAEKEPPILSPAIEKNVNFENRSIKDTCVYSNVGMEMINDEVDCSLISTKNIFNIHRSTSCPSKDLNNYLEVLTTEVPQPPLDIKVTDGESLEEQISQEKAVVLSLAPSLESIKIQPSQSHEINNEVDSPIKDSSRRRIIIRIAKLNILEDELCKKSTNTNSVQKHLNLEEKPNKQQKNLEQSHKEETSLTNNVLKKSKRSKKSHQKKIEKAEKQTQSLEKNICEAEVKDAINLEIKDSKIIPEEQVCITIQSGSKKTFMENDDKDQYEKNKPIVNSKDGTANNPCMIEDKNKTVWEISTKCGEKNRLKITSKKNKKNKPKQPSKQNIFQQEIKNAAKDSKEEYVKLDSSECFDKEANDNKKTSYAKENDKDPRVNDKSITEIDTNLGKHYTGKENLENSTAIEHKDESIGNRTLDDTKIDENLSVPKKISSDKNASLIEMEIIDGNFEGLLSATQIVEMQKCPSPSSKNAHNYSEVQTTKVESFSLTPEVVDVEPLGKQIPEEEQQSSEFTQHKNTKDEVHSPPKDDLRKKLIIRIPKLLVSKEDLHKGIAETPSLSKNITPKIQKHLQNVEHSRKYQITQETSPTKIVLKRKKNELKSILKKKLLPEEQVYKLDDSEIINNQAENENKDKERNADKKQHDAIKSKVTMNEDIPELACDLSVEGNKISNMIQQNQSLQSNISKEHNSVQMPRKDLELSQQGQVLNLGTSKCLNKPKVIADNVIEPKSLVKTILNEYMKESAVKKNTASNFEILDTKSEKVDLHDVNVEDEKKLSKNKTEKSRKMKNHHIEKESCSANTLQLKKSAENTFKLKRTQKLNSKQSIEPSAEQPILEKNKTPIEVHSSYKPIETFPSSILKPSTPNVNISTKDADNDKSVAKKSVVKKVKFAECQTEMKSPVRKHDLLFSSKCRKIASLTGHLDTNKIPTNIIQIRHAKQEHSIEPDSSTEVAKELQRTENILTEEESNLSTKVQVAIGDLGEASLISDSEISRENAPVALESDSAIVFYPSRDSAEDQEVSCITSQKNDNDVIYYYNDENGTPVLDEKNSTEDESPSNQSKITSLSKIKVPTTDVLPSVLISQTPQLIEPIVPKSNAEPLKCLLKRRTIDKIEWNSSSASKESEPNQISIDNIDVRSDESVAPLRCTADENLEHWYKKLGISKSFVLNRENVSNSNSNSTKSIEISMENQKNDRQPIADEESFNFEDFNAAAILTSLKAPKEKSHRSRKRLQPTRITRSTSQMVELAESFLQHDSRQIIPSKSGSESLCEKDSTDNFNITEKCIIPSSNQNHSELTESIGSSDSDDTGKLVIDLDAKRLPKASEKPKSKKNKKGKVSTSSKIASKRNKKTVTLIDENPSFSPKKRRGRPRVSKDLSTESPQATTATKPRRGTVKQKKTEKSNPKNDQSLEKSKSSLEKGGQVDNKSQHLIDSENKDKRNEEHSTSYYKSSSCSVTPHNMNKETWLENLTLRKVSKSLDTEVKEPTKNISLVKRVLSEPSLLLTSKTNVCVLEIKKEENENLSEILKETETYDKNKTKFKHDIHEGTKLKIPCLKEPIKVIEKKMQISSTQKQLKGEKLNKCIRRLSIEKSNQDETRKQTKKRKQRNEESQILEDQSPSVITPIFEAIQSDIPPEIVKSTKHSESVPENKIASLFETNINKNEIKRDTKTARVEAEDIERTKSITDTFNTTLEISSSNEVEKQVNATAEKSDKIPKKPICKTVDLLESEDTALPSKVSTLMEEQFDKNVDVSSKKLKVSKTKSQKGMLTHNSSVSSDPASRIIKDSILVNEPIKKLISATEELKISSLKEPIKDIETKIGILRTQKCIRKLSFEENNQEKIPKQGKSRKRKNEEPTTLDDQTASVSRPTFETLDVEESKQSDVSPIAVKSALHNSIHQSAKQSVFVLENKTNIDKNELKEEKVEKDKIIKQIKFIKDIYTTSSLNEVKQQAQSTVEKSNTIIKNASSKIVDIGESEDTTLPSMISTLSMLTYSSSLSPHRSTNIVDGKVLVDPPKKELISSTEEAKLKVPILKESVKFIGNKMETLNTQTQEKPQSIEENNQDNTNQQQKKANKRNEELTILEDQSQSDSAPTSSTIRAEESKQSKIVSKTVQSAPSSSICESTKLSELVSENKTVALSETNINKNKIKGEQETTKAQEAENIDQTKSFTDAYNTATEISSLDEVEKQDESTEEKANRSNKKEISKIEDFSESGDKVFPSSVPTLNEEGTNSKTSKAESKQEMLIADSSLSSVDPSTRIIAHTVFVDQHKTVSLPEKKVDINEVNEEQQIVKVEKVIKSVAETLDTKVDISSLNEVEKKVILNIKKENESELIELEGTSMVSTLNKKHAHKDMGSDTALVVELKKELTSSNEEAKLKSFVFSKPGLKKHRSKSFCEILEKNEILEEQGFLNKRLKRISLDSHLNSKNISTIERDAKNLINFVKVSKSTTARTTPTKKEDDVERFLDISISIILGTQSSNVTDSYPTNVIAGEGIKQDSDIKENNQSLKVDNNKQTIKKSAETLPKRKLPSLDGVQSLGNVSVFGRRRSNSASDLPNTLSSESIEEAGCEKHQETLKNKSQNEAKKTSVLSFTNFLDLERDFFLDEINDANYNDTREDQSSQSAPTMKAESQQSVQSFDCMFSGNRGQDDEDKLIIFNSDLTLEAVQTYSPAENNDIYLLDDLFPSTSTLMNASENVSGGNSESGEKPKTDIKKTESTPKKETITCSVKGGVEEEKSSAIVEKEAIDVRTSEYELNDGTINNSCLKTKLSKSPLVKLFHKTTPDKQNNIEQSTESISGSKLKSRQKPFWKPVKTYTKSKVVQETSKLYTSLISLAENPYPIDDVKSIPDHLDDIFEVKQPKTPFKNEANSYKDDISKERILASLPTDDRFDQLKNESPVNTYANKTPKPVLENSLSPKTNDNSSGKLDDPKTQSISFVASIPSIPMELCKQKDETKKSLSHNRNIMDQSNLNINSLKATAPCGQTNEPEKFVLESNISKKPCLFKEIDENKKSCEETGETDDNLRNMILHEDNNSYHKKAIRQSRVSTVKKSPENFSMQQICKEEICEEKSSSKHLTSKPNASVPVTTSLQSIPNSLITSTVVNQCEYKISDKVTCSKNLLEQPLVIKTPESLGKNNEIQSTPENNNAAASKQSLKRHSSLSDAKIVPEPPAKMFCPEISAKPLPVPVDSSILLKSSSSVISKMSDPFKHKISGKTSCSPKSLKQSLVINPDQSKVIVIQPTPLNKNLESCKPSLKRHPSFSDSSQVPANPPKIIRSEIPAASVSLQQKVFPVLIQKSTFHKLPHCHSNTSSPNSSKANDVVRNQKITQPSTPITRPVSANMPSQSPRNSKLTSTSISPETICSDKQRSTSTPLGTPRAMATPFGKPNATSTPSSTQRFNHISSTSSSPSLSPWSANLAKLTADVDNIRNSISKLPEVDQTYRVYKRRKTLLEDLENKQEELNELKKKQKEYETQIHNISKSNSERKHRSFSQQSNDLKRKDDNIGQRSEPQFSKSRTSGHTSNADPRKEPTLGYVNKFGDLDKINFSNKNDHSADTNPEAKKLPPWDPKPSLTADEIIRKLRSK